MTRRSFIAALCALPFVKALPKFHTGGIVKPADYVVGQSPQGFDLPRKLADKIRVDIENLRLVNDRTGEPYTVMHVEAGDHVILRDSKSFLFCNLRS